MLEGNTLRAKLVENTPAQGTLGFKGERGYSNYEIYVKNGGTLTEQEWLDHFGVDLTDVIKVQDIVNNVTTNNSAKPLSAAQGRYLKNYIDTYTENEIGDTPSLDTTSKIVVGAINEVNAKTKSDSDIVDLIYPVGSIYLSVDSTNPGTLFGGTWVQLKDKFLLGAGDTYTAGDTGGEATHTLTTSEMPSHNHSAGSGSSFMVYSGTDIGFDSGTYYVRGHQSNTASTGGGQAHNNMPPYLTIFMWKRTS